MRRRLSNRAMGVVVLLLCSGSVACEKQKADPYYVLSVTARVIDEAGSPIQGIYVYPDGYSFRGREGYSDYKGEIYGIAYLSPGDAGIIHFEDVDGEYNGGLYESLSVDISNQIAPYKKKPDDWGYTGSSFVKMGDIILKKVK